MIRVNALAWVKSPEKYEYVIVNVEPENKFIMLKNIFASPISTKLFFSIFVHPLNYHPSYSWLTQPLSGKKSLFLRGAGDCTLANKALNSSFQLTVTQGLGFWETAHLPLP